MPTKPYLGTYKAQPFGYRTYSTKLIEALNEETLTARTNCIVELCRHLRLRGYANQLSKYSPAAALDSYKQLPPVHHSEQNGYWVAWLYKGISAKQCSRRWKQNLQLRLDRNNSARIHKNNYSWRLLNFL